MVQLLQDLADEFADFAQGMVRGNPLLRMNVRKHPALILRSSAHLQSSRRIRGGLNHHSFALARFFSKLLVQSSPSTPRRSSVLFSASFSAPSVADGSARNPISQPVPNPGSTSAMKISSIAYGARYSVSEPSTGSGVRLVPHSDGPQKSGAAPPIRSGGNGASAGRSISSNSCR